jgi:hypothetical protein
MIASYLPGRRDEDTNDEKSKESNIVLSQSQHSEIGGVRLRSMVT